VGQDLRVLLVTVTREDGEPGILGIARIAEGKFAKKECGAAIGFQLAGMNAIGAKAELLGVPAGFGRFRHG
jgi:hypothetical protein